MYKSCHIVKHGLCFFDNKLASCCFSPVDHVKGQVPPVIFPNYKGQVLSAEELFKRMDIYISVFKNGGCPRECMNCYHIEDKDWDEEKFIDYITITHFSNCNADCIYCSNNNTPQERTNNIYKIMPVLKSFMEQGLIKKGCELHIGGGEFTIYDECDEILEMFAVSNYSRVFIPTNAIIYSHNLFRAMDEATTYIIVSLDCGSRKLYKKIKRVDKFNKVIENLKKYAATKKSQEAIRLKYIIIPTINDNIHEFKQFLKIAKMLHVKNLIIDIDARYSRMTEYNIDPYFINLAEKMNSIALRQNFVTEFYSFLLQNTNNKKMYKLNILQNIIKRIKFKYFNKKIKDLYLYHHYGLNRLFDKKFIF